MIKRYRQTSLKRTARTRARVGQSLLAYKLVANRSNKYMYAQIVALTTGKTVAGVRAKKATEAGQEIAKKAVKAKIKDVVFDRGPYRYHGRIKQLADAAREAGLKF